MPLKTSEYAVFLFEPIHIQNFPLKENRTHRFLINSPINNYVLWNKDWSLLTSASSFSFPSSLSLVCKSLEGSVEVNSTKISKERERRRTEAPKPALGQKKRWVVRCYVHVIGVFGFWSSISGIWSSRSKIFDLNSNNWNMIIVELKVMISFLFTKKGFPLERGHPTEWRKELEEDRWILEQSNSHSVSSSLAEGSQSRVGKRCLDQGRRRCSLPIGQTTRPQELVLHCHPLEWKDWQTMSRTMV